MISKIIDGTKASALDKLIKENNKVVITTHVSPDGDAIGSSIGLYHYLKERGCEVKVVVPNAFPSFLTWVDGANDIVVYEYNKAFGESLIMNAELLFCLDYNAPSRTRFLTDFILESKAKKVMIDHHPEPANFCDVTFSYPELSSTCELLFRIICRMGDFDEITPSCAEAIYMGMMTDTGGFTYNSNNSQIYYIISQLIDKGINKDQIYSNVYHNYSVDRYRMMGYALADKMKVYEKYNTALIFLSDEEQKRFNSKKGDTEGFANLPLNIKGIIFAGFIREDNDMVKISLRSQGDFPANKFASQYYNGGGHFNAAGGEFYGTLDEAVAVFEKGLPEYKNLLIKK